MNYIDFDSAKLSQCPLLTGTIGYLEGFLSKPHPALEQVGFNGSVCPFTSQVLNNNTLCFSTEIIDVSTDSEQSRVKESLVDFHLEYFLKTWEPSIKLEKQRLASLLIITFGPKSAVECEMFISSVQKELQPRFVETGLLLSELHPHSNVPSVRCPVFYPSRPPFPLFFIRRIIPNDIPYLLRKDRYDEKTYDLISKSLNRDFEKEVIIKEMKRLNKSFS